MNRCALICVCLLLCCGATPIQSPKLAQEMPIAVRVSSAVPPLPDGTVPRTLAVPNLVVQPPSQPQWFTNQLRFDWPCWTNDNINHIEVATVCNGPGAPQYDVTNYCAVEWSPRLDTPTWTPVATNNQSPIMLTIVSTNAQGFLRGRYFWL